MKSLKIALLTFVLFAASAFGKDLFIDLRRSSDPTGSTYFITFAQRAGSRTGHAFVVWSGNDARNRMSVYSAHGFYPRRGVQIFSRVPSGELRNDAVSDNPDVVQNRLRVQVDYFEWHESLKAIDRWRTSDYRLFKRNCIDFVRDVARTVGLDTPRRRPTERPESYLKRLIYYNE